MRQRAHLSTNYCVSETLNHFCSLLKTPLPLFKACLHDCAAALAVKNWSRVGSLQIWRLFTLLEHP